MKPINKYETLYRFFMTHPREFVTMYKKYEQLLREMYPVPPTILEMDDEITCYQNKPKWK